MNVSLTATMSSGLWFVVAVGALGSVARDARGLLAREPLLACAFDGCAWIERGDAAASSFSRYGRRAGAPCRGALVRDPRVEASARPASRRGSAG